VHRAAKAGTLARLTACLATPGVDINSRDNNGYTALHEAVQQGQLEAVRLLLQFTPDPQCPGDRVDLFAQDEEDGLSPLHEAVQAGEEEVVRLILQMAWQEEETTPHTSARLPSVKKLLDNKTKDGQTAMDLATSKGIIDLLRSADEKTRDITQYMDEQATSSEGDRSARNLKRNFVETTISQDHSYSLSARTFPENISSCSSLPPAEPLNKPLKKNLMPRIKRQDEYSSELRTPEEYSAVETNLMDVNDGQKNNSPAEKNKINECKLKPRKSEESIGSRKTEKNRISTSKKRKKRQGNATKDGETKLEKSTNEKEKRTVEYYPSKPRKMNIKIQHGRILQGMMDSSEEEDESRPGKKLKTSMIKSSQTKKEVNGTRTIDKSMQSHNVSDHAEAYAVQTDIFAVRSVALNGSSPPAIVENVKHDTTETTGGTEGTNINLDKIEMYRCTICGQDPIQPNRSELYRHYAVKHFCKEILDLVKKEVTCPICCIDITNVKSSHVASHLGQRHDWVEKFLPEEAIIPKKTLTEGKRFRPKKRNSMVKATATATPDKDEDCNRCIFQDTPGAELDEAGNLIAVTVEFDELCSDIICAVCKIVCLTVADTVKHMWKKHQIHGLEDVEAAFLQLSFAKLVKIESRYELDKYSIPILDS